MENVRTGILMDAMTALASTLKRIAGGLYASTTWRPSATRMATERYPASAHMFTINPLHTHAHDRLFAFHPATENRVAALRALAGQMRPVSTRGPWA